MGGNEAGDAKAARASNLIDQMMAARDQRRAQEAARAAERARAMARFEAEARAVAQARLELDDERKRRDAARKRLEEEAAALELEKQRVEESERLEREARERAADEDRRLHEEVAAERQRLDEEERVRREAREQLAAEAARLAAEREQLARAAEEEARREAGLRETERAMEAQRQHEAAERAAAAAARRSELDQLDQRLEARAAAERPAASPPPTIVGPPRRKSRLKVSATVLVEHHGELLALPVLNASLTGGLFSTEGRDFGSLRIGGMLILTLVSNEDTKQQVDLVARVVRVDAAAVAVDWSQLEEQAAHAIARLLHDTSGSSEERTARREAERLEIEEIAQHLELREAGAQSTRGLSAPEPPPAPTRRRPRLRLAASVLVDHDGTQVELGLLNVSLTGGLVRTHGTSLSRQRVGALLLLTLTVASSDEASGVAEYAPVDLMARVVRHEGDLTAVDWSQDQAAELGVARLLDALAHKD